MSEAHEVIASLYLPLTEGKLLLPNVSVAEVVDFCEPEVEADMPAYYLGKVVWRGVSVPLLSYEIANGETQADASDRARIAVINGTSEQQALPFFAILTQGIPRLVKVTADLIELSDEALGAADAAKVRVDSENAVVPNLTYLESLLSPLI